jgi:hypothetical protein
MKALIHNGVDERKRIVGVNAPHPVLFNLPFEFIDRFRNQLELVDVQFEGDPEIIRKAVWSCYQENPVAFRSYSLHDPGAYPEEPLSRGPNPIMERREKPLTKQGPWLRGYERDQTKGHPMSSSWRLFSITTRWSGPRG